MGADDIGRGFGMVMGGLMDYTPPGFLLNVATGGRLRETLTGDEARDAAKRVREAQDKLEQQRKKQLDDQAAARAAAQAKAETAGQRVGARGRFLSGVGSTGFGAGTTAQGLGAGSLFGN